MANMGQNLVAVGFGVFWVSALVGVAALIVGGVRQHTRKERSDGE